VLWRSAPPTTLMRVNAPISALLAFAALFLIPAASLAKPAHHVGHKTSVGTSGHRKSAYSSNRHRGQSTARVKTQTVKHHHSRHRAPSVTEQANHRQLTAPTNIPQKASSEDFLKAAESPAEIPAPVAIHGTSRPEEADEPAPRSRGRKAASVAKPVSVVGAVRTTTRRPQLPSVEEAVATPVILPSLYNKRGRLIVPAPLKGSREILIHQNQVADRDGLDRIRDDEDIVEMRNDRLLVSLPASDALQVDERLPLNRRYCRPWTAQFLATLARAHYAHFHTALQVNSAVRTVEFQQHLVRINGNAAPAEGDTASPHLTGQAVDIAKHGLSLTEIAWLRGYLLPLVQEGKVDVEEEFQQACFHISVYRKYLPPASSPNPAPSHHAGTTALAAALR
jgi:Family of unknown function (DUF5715)